jgi:hypothetical protein
LLIRAAVYHAEETIGDPCSVDPVFSRRVEKIDYIGKKVDRSSHEHNPQLLG